jgi:cystathionine beta-synthase
MGKPYPVVKGTTNRRSFKTFTKENQAVIVELENGKHHIITNMILLAL